jgi:hypothetical protein
MYYNEDTSVEVAAFVQLFLFVAGCYLFTPEKREPSFFDQRLCWESYVAKHSRRGTLDIRLRMREESFNKLLSYICHDLIVNETMAKRRGGTIIPEICLFCTLRWLAGGSYLDICDITGISNASFYRVVDKTVHAIVRNKALEIHFPDTTAELEAAVKGFASISYKEAIRNCVGVIDGYLLRIKVPRKDEVGNVRSYFSGHYQCYGVNVQAIADHHSWFVSSIKHILG